MAAKILPLLFLFHFFLSLKTMDSKKVHVNEIDSISVSYRVNRENMCTKVISDKKIISKLINKYINKRTKAHVIKAKKNYGIAIYLSNGKRLGYGVSGHYLSTEEGWYRMLFNPEKYLKKISCEELK